MTETTLTLAESLVCSTAIAAAMPAAKNRRRLFTYLALLAGVMAYAGIRTAIATEAWVGPYARMLIPGARVLEGGELVTPPAATVRDGYIVDFRPPGQ